MFDSERKPSIPDGISASSFGPTPMVPTQLIRLTALMERTAGGPDVSIGLIDGPVFSRHPHLNAQNLRQIGDLNRADEYLLGKGALRHISLDASDAEPDWRRLDIFPLMRCCGYDRSWGPSRKEPVQQEHSSAGNCRSTGNCAYLKLLPDSLRDFNR
jgi:hypothetical protein